MSDQAGFSRPRPRDKCGPSPMNGQPVRRAIVKARLGIVGWARKPMKVLVLRRPWPGSDPMAMQSSVATTQASALPTEDVPEYGRVTTAGIVLSEAAHWIEEGAH